MRNAARCGRGVRVGQVELAHAASNRSRLPLARSPSASVRWNRAKKTNMQKQNQRNDVLTSSQCHPTMTVLTVELSQIRSVNFGNVNVLRELECQFKFACRLDRQPQRCNVRTHEAFWSN